MHDIRFIRDNPDAFDQGLKRRGLPAMSAEILKRDEARRAHLTKLHEAQSRRNAASKEIGRAKGAKDEATANKLMQEVAELKTLIQEGEAAERGHDRAVTELLEAIPNLPRAEVPDGKESEDNKEVRRVGTPGQFNFAPKQHFEIGEALGLMDFETAAKISGARFVVLKGQLAKLERAIAQFMLDIHTAPANGQIGGYTEHQVPYLVKSASVYGTGSLPKFEDDLFAATNSAAVRLAARAHLESSLPQLLHMIKSNEKLFAPEEELQVFLGQTFTTMFEQFAEDEAISASRRWLIPTAEVPLTNFVREQIVAEADLPMRLTAWTPCFRSEAGSAGRDVRGMIRQHQFSKVELVSITTPEQSLDEHERMTASAEEVLKRLGLPYRVMLLCTGDMGFASQKTYDIEVWLPGQNAYREISSCSVCGDFQARRMNARYRPKVGKETRYVHTLNGSGLAVGRTLIAILENYQNADGTVTIPQALTPYMGGLTQIGG